MQLRTQNGYLLGEVISALQKEIRRNKEKEAMFWALELVPKYERYLWRRLTLIVHEDIGIANPPLLTLVSVTAQSYSMLRENNVENGSRLLLANVILLMCRSPKSRIADHFQCVINFERRKGNLIPIPDYALDKHTGKGKQLSRGWDHWFTEGTVLIEESTEVDDIYKKDAHALWSDPENKNLPEVVWKSGAKKQKSLFDSEEESGTDKDVIDD